MNNNSARAYLALLGSSLIWALTVPLMKLTLQEIPIFTLAFIRFGGASLLLFPFVYNKLTIKRGDILMLVLASFCGVSLNIAFFFSGLKFTTALNTVLLGTTGPLFVLLAAHIFLKEKWRKKTILGALLCFTGVGVVIGRDIISNGLHLSPIGDTFILLSVLSFVGYAIISKKLNKIYSFPVLAFCSFLIGAITFAIPAIFEYFQNPLWVKNVSNISIFGAFYGIVFSSLFAYSLWQWALTRLEATSVAIFGYIDPALATIASVLILGETITPIFILGAWLILSGIVVAQGHIPHPLMKYLQHKVRQGSLK